MHTFKLINHGPSYTNQDKILKLYFPKSNLTSLFKTPNITDITCTKEISDELVPEPEPIPSDENPFGCVKDQCIVLSCTIPRYWEKGQEKEFNLEVQFNPTFAEEYEDQTFSVYSIASIDDQQTMALTKMSKVALGAIEKLAQSWPIVLGVCIGFSVILGTLLVFWRTGILAKMRPYKLDEEEVKRENRKTQIRFSEIRMSEIPQKDE